MGKDEESYLIKFWEVTSNFILKMSGHIDPWLRVFPYFPWWTNDRADRLKTLTGSALEREVMGVKGRWEILKPKEDKKELTKKEAIEKAFAVLNAMSPEELRCKMKEMENTPLAKSLKRALKGE